MRTYLGWLLAAVALPLTAYAQGSDDQRGA